jgi:hypothetical protein
MCFNPHRNSLNTLCSDLLQPLMMATHYGPPIYCKIQVLLQVQGLSVGVRLKGWCKGQVVHEILPLQV